MDKPKLQSSEFIVSSDQINLDLKMVAFDIWGSKAHILMLLKNEVIDKVTAKKCLEALREIESEYHEGKFEINPEKGAQLTLEAKIIEKAGDAGYSVHTGRSRNDQVMVTELLYLREEMLGIFENMLPVLESLLQLAKEEKATIMPGYTHMQPGKITTLGQWALAYLNGFLRSLETIKYYLSLYDMNPLGACESYGTSWPLDREYTTKYLGFSEVWEIPQDAIASRGLPQLGYLNSLVEICIVASKLNEDLILFNTFEYEIVELGDEVAQRMHPITGSSVMAQKKNPDVLEIIRSTAPQVIGFYSIVGNILASLPMGYNRDSRESKEYIQLGLVKTNSVIKSLQKIIPGLKWNKGRMLDLATNNYSLTTDLADYISQETKIGYRLVYKIVGQVVEQAILQGKPLNKVIASEFIKKAAELKIKLTISDEEIKKALDPKLVIEKRKNIGGSNKVIMQKSLEEASKKIKLEEFWIKKKYQVIKKAQQSTDSQINKIIRK